ncbi:MAG: RluA family pseudouridine synthase [Alphaproteobacteria bacterium]|nr:RluA family pseudouridine synthase [Alphaproteobacteria bacterium]
MSQEITDIFVKKEEEQMRLDRWFKKEFPALTHGQLEKMLREKRIRLNKKKAKSDTRLEEGDMISFPTEALGNFKTRKKQKYVLSKEEVAFIRSLVLYKDEEVIALNKPAGIPVQGGSKQIQYIEKYLDGLMFEKKERPYLVHRLDKDTSGVLLLGRSRKAAEILGRDFKSKNIQKVYLAIAEGCPKIKQGRIEAPLMKKLLPQENIEKMVVDEEKGQFSLTYYQVLEDMKKVSLVALAPKTGRTHQLRVHLSFMGNPILGDRKYGSELASEFKFSNQMHLHAYQITFSKVFSRSKQIQIRADIPPHMKEAFEFFHFDKKPEIPSFDE